MSPRRHQWTPEEDALLRRHYSEHPASWIAERIFGTPHATKAVYHRAVLLGLRKWPHHPPELIEAVRHLHAEGLHDRDIARRLGRDRDQVHAIRYARLKLPANAAAVAAAARQAVRTQYERLGIRSAGELRALSYRRYAVENGWPADLRPRAVQILNLLSAAGVPLSRRQIADGIGMRWKGSRRSLASNDPEGSYLAHLAARGLVTRLVCAGPHPGPGKGRNIDLYQLGPEAITILAQKAKEEQSCPASTRA